MEDFDRPISAKERIRLARLVSESLEPIEAKLSPVKVAARGKIGKTLWGETWCKNLDRYEDCDYRLQAGRSILRAEGLLDLCLAPNLARARVWDGATWDVNIKFTRVDDETWDPFLENFDTLKNLGDILAGIVPEDLSRKMIDEDLGIAPSRQDIRFDCNCLDYADLCSHVACALYGIGKRIDDHPELFFMLRGKTPEDILNHNKGKFVDDPSHTELNRQEMEDLFDIEFES